MIGFLDSMGVIFLVLFIVIGSATAAAIAIDALEWLVKWLFKRMKK